MNNSSHFFCILGWQLGQNGLIAWWVHGSTRIRGCSCWWGPIFVHFWVIFTSTSSLSLVQSLPSVRWVIGWLLDFLKDNELPTKLQWIFSRLSWSEFCQNTISPVYLCFQRIICSFVCISFKNSQIYKQTLFKIVR